MTIFSSSNPNSANLFPAVKYVKMYNNQFVAIDRSNIVSSINIGDIKIPYNNWNRLRTTVPAGNNNFVLSYPLIGIKPTMLVIKPDYCGCHDSKKYLYWKYLHSSEPFNTMTDLMVLTGTNTNPIPQIVLSNPDNNKSVIIDIFVVATDSDVYTDSEQYYYLQNMIYDNITSDGNGVLYIYNENNELALTVDIEDINNIFSPQPGRIIIDDSTKQDIILDFTNPNDALQILSSLLYLLNNPEEELPLPLDDLAPVITFTNIVNDNEAEIEIDSDNNEIITKQHLIDILILSCIDDRDGNINLNSNNVKILNNDNNNIGAIVMPGVYNIEFKVQDIAGNETIEIVELTVNEFIITGILINNNDDILTNNDDVILLI